MTLAETQVYTTLMTLMGYICLKKMTGPFTNPPEFMVSMVSSTHLPPHDVTSKPPQKTGSPKHPEYPEPLHSGYFEDLYTPAMQIQTFPVVLEGPMILRMD